VLLDQDRCIGCKFCMLVCPFGVIALSRDGKAMIKCDLCVERTEAGELPACVAACPTGALKFVELDEHLRQRRREAVRRVAQVRAKTDEL
jgi:carbon-monoxide dehydrogenase iron sulfur subunit